MNSKARRANSVRSLSMKIPPDELEALNQAIHVFGIVKLAEKINVSVSTIQGWRTRGLPPERAPEIEGATGVSRKRLKPLLYK